MKVRYKQTAFGVAWALLQPLSLMLVFAIFLGRLVKVPSEGIPYAVFVYTGLVLWTFFSQSLTGSANSLVHNSNLISKVYFPRLVLPLAAVASHLPDLLVALVLLAALVVLYGVELTATLAFVPLFIIFTTATVIAAGVWLASLNVRWRDVGQAMPFIVQLWLFITPVVYPASLVPTAWRHVYALNPMTAATEGFRWAILGTSGPAAVDVLISLAVTLVGIVLALRTFASAERYFADEI